MGNAGRVWVVGSANMDLVFRTERFPEPGETVLGTGFATQPGGKGANQAVAVGRLGGSVSFVGAVGDDLFGAELRSSLGAAGVDLGYLAIAEGHPTGTAGILVDHDGQNMIVVAPGANSTVSGDQVRFALTGAEDSPVLAQLEIPNDAIEAAAASPRLILNPAPARPLTERILEGLYGITPNQSEVEQITGIEADNLDGARAAAKELLGRGVLNVVITLGGKGCYWTNGREELYQDALTVRVVDTTAAGDAFNGALAHFLADGREWQNALELANCVAALSCTRTGAQASMPSRDDLAALAGKHL